MNCFKEYLEGLKKLSDEALAKPEEENCDSQLDTYKI